MRRVAALLGALLLLAAEAASPFAGPRVASASPAAADEAFAARVVELTNQERAAAGLDSLAVHPSLVGAAQGYANVLASTGCFGHSCGSQVADRGREAGYAGWSALGENIASGQRSPEEVVAGWMASDGHRANILGPSFAEIGVGLAVGGQYGMYWTQVFGSGS